MSGFVGRSSARAKVLRDRRVLRELGVSDAPAGRLSGLCELCGLYHVAPDLRTECPACGEPMCWGGCACEKGEG